MQVAFSVNILSESSMNKAESIDRLVQGRGSGQVAVLRMLYHARVKWITAVVICAALFATDLGFFRYFFVRNGRVLQA